MNLIDKYDVIVVGGGPSGVAAACASARDGAKTLLIEQTGVLGGMGTIGLVPSFGPFDNGKEMVYRGIGRDILYRMNKEIDSVPNDNSCWPPIQSEILKRVYDEIVEENGVEVMFFSMLCDVDVNGSIIDSITVANKQGLTKYKAKVYIDCSGDADMVAMAGCNFVVGDNNGGETQPATLCFTISNIDDYAYLNGPDFHVQTPGNPIFEIAKSEKYPLIVDHHICYSHSVPGTVSFNAGHIFNVNPLDVMSLSKSMIQGRKIAHQFLEAFREYQPRAFANAFVSSTASVLGVRESRRIVGEYILTVDDYIARRSFDDEIARNSYFIDVHMTLEEQEDGKKVENAKHTYKPGESHGIPYRCLLPKELDNVVVAGKTISCDRAVQGSIRIMPACLATGEAAGIAAAIATNENLLVKYIEVDKLRNKIYEYGGYIK